MLSVSGSIAVPASRRALAWRAELGRACLIERDRLVLWLPVCVGIGDAVYFSCRSEPRAWPALVLALVALALRLAVRQFEAPRILAAAMLAGACGFLAAHLATGRAAPMPPLPRRAAIVSGKVASVELFHDASRRLTIAHATIGEDPPISRLLRIKLREDDDQTIAVGDDVTIRAMLRSPAPPSFPGARDLQREAFFGNLMGSGYALGEARITAHDAPHGIAARWQRLREAVANRITAALPGSRGAIAATLLTGISTTIPQSDRDAFAVSGLAHLLAVAGLHLGIVMGLTMGGLRMALAAWEYGALRLPTRQIAAVAALAAGGLYMALTGMHLPTIRSLSMAALVVLGLLLGRRAVSMRGLGWAATLLMLTSPDCLLEVSFQMSFAAVLALISGYEALRPFMTAVLGEGGFGRRLALHVAALFLTSLLAGTASTPFAVYHFGHIQFYFVLANLLAVPLTALWVLPEGLLSLALMPFGLERFILLPMGWGIDIILWLARSVSALPAASLAVRAMPLWGLGVLSMGLIWLCLRRGPWRLLGLLPLAVGLLTPFACRPPDLLVSADARLIALRVPQQPGGAHLLLEEGSGASPIVLSDWNRAQATERPPAYMPESGTTGAVTCDPIECRISLRGQTVLLLREGRHTSPDLDCGSASLLVSPTPAHRTCQALPRIDRFTVWREGSQAVWIGPGAVRVVSDQDLRGSRPWIPVPGKRRVPALPMARTE